MNVCIESTIFLQDKKVMFSVLHQIFIKKYFLIHILENISNIAFINFYLTGYTGVNCINFSSNDVSFLHENKTIAIVLGAD